MIRYLMIASLIVFAVSCGQRVADESGKIKILDGALIARTSKLWKNGQTLNVTFLDGTEKDKNDVEKFAVEWSLYANIKFAFFKTPSDLPKNKKADIVVSFNRTGNNSSVGTDSSYSSASGHSMSLSDMGPNLNVRRFVILHEFGHAIGLEHEHQHLNRTFRLDEEKALEYCRNTIKFTDEMCRTNIFQTISGKDVYLSTYDPNSIMHYSLHPDIIVGKIDLRANQSLSLLDKLEIAKMYPGRATQEEIMAMHENKSAEVAATSSYKNCKINVSTSEVRRLDENGSPVLKRVNVYSFSSIVDGEFNYQYVWEDKEGVLEMVKAEPYCNMEENELAEFRAKKFNERLSKKVFGNCQIALTETGAPKPSLCPASAAFRVYDSEGKESIDNLCYSSFDNAYDVMTKSSYCKMDPIEMISYLAAKKEEDEAKREFGKCYVENNLSLKNSVAKEVRCRKETPYFILNKEKRQPMNGYCYGDSRSAISDMKDLAGCR